MDALEETYRCLRGPLWRYLLVECADASMADDLVIDAFVRAGREAGVGDLGRDGFDRRIWSLAVESAASARAERRETLEAAASETDLSVTLIDPDAPAIAGILHPLDGLPERQRTIVALTCAGDLDANRVADLLSTSVDAVEIEREHDVTAAVRAGLARIGEIRPPELWPRIVQRLAPPSPAAWFRRGGLAAVAAAAALLVIVGFGFRWLADPTTGPAAPPVPPATSVPSPSSTVWQPERETRPLEPDARSEWAGALAKDATGLWVAEPGRGIANLDPATGDVRWRLALDGTPGGVQGVPGIGWFVWSSFTGEDDRRPPVLLRVDPVSGEVLWRADGRSGFDWGSEPLAVSGDQVFIADVADASQERVWIAEPSRPAPGGRSSIRAYDVERGVLDFAVAVDGPVGVTADAPLVHVLPTEEQPIVLATVPRGSLSRLDPFDGAIRWSQPVDPAATYASARTEDGTLAVRVSTSPIGTTYLDAATGRPLDDVTPPPPTTGCRTYYGPAAEVALSGEPPAQPDCIVVAESQDLRLRNDGSGLMTLSWIGRRLSVGPDDVVEWTPTEGAHPLGRSVVDVEPYPDLTVWVVASESSPTAGIRRTAGSFGPVEVGMRVADASALLGRELEVVVHDTSGACAVIAGDPYSPFFRSVAATGGLIITGIDRKCLLESSRSWQWTNKTQ